LVLISQSFSVESFEPDSSILESGDQVSWYTASIWPINYPKNLPFTPFQILILRSNEALARYYPLGENKT